MQSTTTSPRPNNPIDDDVRSRSIRFSRYDMNYSVEDYTMSMTKLSMMLAHRQQNGKSNKIYLERNIEKSTNKNRRKRGIHDIQFPYSQKVFNFDKELTVYILGFGSSKLHLLPNDCFLKVSLESYQKIRKPCAKRKRASKPAVHKKVLMDRYKLPSKHKMKSINIHDADKISLPASSLNDKQQHFFVFEVFNSSDERIYVGKHHYSKTKSQGDISIFTSRTDNLKEIESSSFVNPVLLHDMQEFVDSKNKNRHMIPIENLVKDQEYI